MRKRLLFTSLILLFVLTAAAQNMKVAVMETKAAPGVSVMQSKLVRGGMEVAVSNAPGYEGYDRAAFDKILEEQNFQRSGAVDGNQIREMGIMAGVQYVLVTEAANEDGYFYILAKLLDVETGRFIKSAEELCESSPTDIKEACSKLGVQLFGGNMIGKNNGSFPRSSVGVLNGTFSVSTSMKVRFSKGNLQYKATTNTWRFAENQWSFVGGTDYETGHICGNVYENGSKCDNSKISSTYNGWIDVFGWATSGANHGAVCYQPWSTSRDYENYLAYGNYEYDLSDRLGNADWGYNPISNGGNTSSQWRTLSLEEWNYLLFQRDASNVNGIANARYVTGNVNDVLGLVLLPDVYVHPSVLKKLSGINQYDVSNLNVFSTEEWAIMEKAGCVFLPAAGQRFDNRYRNNDQLSYIQGNYWTATHANRGDAFYLNFYGQWMSTDYLHNCDRGDGKSVRLVQTIE